MSSVLQSFFGFSTGLVRTNTELPEIFPLSLSEEVFVERDLKALYEKIVVDTMERTHGLPEQAQAVLFDSCLEGQNSHGLISLLVKAMYNKSELFLVYNPSLEVLREATLEERRQIEMDYKTRADSSVGVYISFKNFTKTDVLKVYSALEYCLISGLYKGVNLSKAIQFKMNDLRASTSLTDKDDVVAQAKTIAEGLGKGRDVLLDGGDMIEMLKPDLTSVQTGMDFLNEKRSFYLGLPKSYVAGQLQAGLGDSGLGDTKAVDRGLKAFYYSIIKPVVEKIFSVSTTFKSQDLSQMPQSLEALRTFEITGDEILNLEEKRTIVRRLFDLGDDE